MLSTVYAFKVHAVQLMSKVPQVIELGSVNRKALYLKSAGECSPISTEESADILTSV